MKKNILIIKHGSLGDLVLATGAIQAIKNHFSDHNIYILTSSKYKKFIEQAPFVTNVICDDRKSFFNIINNFLLFKKIIRMKFSYIIDLQNSTRTSIYNFIFKFLTNCIISSSRNFAHFRYQIPKHGSEHVTVGLNNQLAMIGIQSFFDPDVEWLKKVPSNINLDKEYVIIIPGTSIKGNYKKWPPNKYAEIAAYFEKKNLVVVVTGTESDVNSAKPIFDICPKAINLLGKSPPEVLFHMAKKAKLIISNDTGPALLVSLSNTPLIWIVNDNNLSKANKPIGKKVYKISDKKISDISVEKVIDVLVNNGLV